MYFLFKQLHKVLIGHFRRFHIDMSVLFFLENVYTILTFPDRIGNIG